MTHPGGKYVRAVERMSGRLGGVASGLVVLIALLGAGNALLRYAGRFAGVSFSSNAWLELQWYGFALIFLLGASATLREDGHVRVDVLYHRLSPRRRAWINLLGTALFLVPFCLLMIWASWRPVCNAWAVWERSPDPGGLPRWPIKTVVPLAFALLLLQGIAAAVRQGAALRRPRPEETAPP